MMTDKEYYSDTKYITNSMLGWLDISPMHYKRVIDNIKNGKDENEKSYYRFGNAVHCYLLEPDEFSKRYNVSSVKRPSNIIQKKFCDFVIASNHVDEKVLLMAFKMAYSTNSLTDDKILVKATKLYNANKEFINFELKNDGRKVLTNSEYDSIKRIYNNIMLNSVIKNALFSKGKELKCFNEQVVLFDSEKYGIKLKSKLDRLVIDVKNKIIKLYDTKTSSVKSEDTNFKKSFTNSFYLFNYGRQLAFYSYAIYNFFMQNFKDLDITEFKIEHYIIAIKSNYDNEVVMFKIENEILESYFKKIDSLLNDLKYYKKNGFNKRRKPFETMEIRNIT